MAAAGVACTVGMFLFGYTLSIGAAAELCAFLQGVMMVGVLIGIFSTLSYGLDAFRTQSNGKSLQADAKNNPACNMVDPRILHS
jgi:hypothetical protein